MPLQWQHAYNLISNRTFNRQDIRSKSIARTSAATAKKQLSLAATCSQRGNMPLKWDVHISGGGINVIDAEGNRGNSTQRGIVHVQCIGTPKACRERHNKYIRLILPEWRRVNVRARYHQRQFQRKAGVHDNAVPQTLYMRTSVTAMPNQKPYARPYVSRSSQNNYENDNGNQMTIRMA